MMMMTLCALYFSQTMLIVGFCKLRGTHGGAASYRDPARRAAATGATPVAGATHGRGSPSTGPAPAVGAATHGTWTASAMGSATHDTHPGPLKYPSPLFPPVWYHFFVGSGSIFVVYKEKLPLIGKSTQTQSFGHPLLT